MVERRLAKRLEQGVQFTSHKAIDGEAEWGKVTVTGLVSFRALPLIFIFSSLEVAHWNTKESQCQQSGHQTW